MKEFRTETIRLKGPATISLRRLRPLCHNVYTYLRWISSKIALLSWIGRCHLCRCQTPTGRRLVASYTCTSLHIYKCKHNISHVTGTTVIVSVEAVVETPEVVYPAAVAAYASVLSYRSEASRSSSRCFSGLREIGEIAD